MIVEAPFLTPLFMISEKPLQQGDQKVLAEAVWTGQNVIFTLFHQRVKAPAAHIPEVGSADRELTLLHGNRCRKKNQKDSIQKRRVICPTEVGAQMTHNMNRAAIGRN